MLNVKVGNQETHNKTVCVYEGFKGLTDKQSV